MSAEADAVRLMTESERADAEVFVRRLADDARANGLTPQALFVGLGAVWVEIAVESRFTDQQLESWLAYLIRIARGRPVS